MQLEASFHLRSKRSRRVQFGWTLLLCLALAGLLAVPAEAAVRFRPSAQLRAAGEDFKIVFFPDSQNESMNYPQAYTAQTTWIVNNQASQNIVFASHVGDIVNDSGVKAQWDNADAAMSVLDLASFPYSVGPGNHDLYGKYDTYFGIDRFLGKPTYAGYYGSDNNNNYSLFSASGMDFILINLEYQPDAGMRAWADNLLTTYANRRAIVVSHSILTSSGSLAVEGASLLNALKDHPNLFLMMSGHAGNAYLAQQGNDGHTIHIMETDFEGWPYGGDGILRVLTFSPAIDMIHVATYSTYHNYYETSSPYEMDLAYDMDSPTGAFGKYAPLEGAAGVSITPTLSWGSSTGASSYDYCYDTTTPCTNWISTGLNTSVSLSGLTYDQTYYWQVRANNPDGQVLANGGNGWSFTTVTPPGPFSQTGPSDGAAGVSVNPTLSWGTSSAATKYEYCYSTTNPCSNWTSNSVKTSVALSALANNTTYYWHVRASNSLATVYAGGVTTDWSFTTAPLPGAFGKTAPTNAVANVPINPTLSWGTSSSAASYQYCYATSNPCSNWTSAGTKTSVTLGGLTNNQVYYWQVRAVSPGGTTLADAGTTWSFTTIIAAPAAFSKSGPSNNATNVSITPTLSWGASNRAASYEYCIANSAAGCTTFLPVTSGTSVSLSGLNYEQTYYWQVRAVNAAGTTYADGSSTSSWSFTTVIAAPAAFSKTGPLDGAVNVSRSPTLSWGASTRAASYEYCIAETRGCSDFISVGANTSVVLSGLGHNQVYYWLVRAVNPGGITVANSGAYWSFTTVDYQLFIPLVIQ